MYGLVGPIQGDNMVALLWDVRVLSHLYLTWVFFFASSWFQMFPFKLKIRAARWIITDVCQIAGTVRRLEDGINT